MPRVKNKNELTKKQFETLVAIIDFIDTNHYAPTIRELCDTLGNTSPATVHQKILTLRKKGYITYTEGKFRTMKVLRGFENEEDNRENEEEKTN